MSWRLPVNVERRTPPVGGCEGPSFGALSLGRMPHLDGPSCVADGPTDLAVSVRNPEKGLPLNLFPGGHSSKLATGAGP